MPLSIATAGWGGVSGCPDGCHGALQHIQHAVDELSRPAEDEGSQMDGWGGRAGRRAGERAGAQEADRLWLAGWLARWLADTTPTEVPSSGEPPAL